MRESGTIIDIVYCSPAYRCVQTADIVLNGESTLIKFWRKDYY